MGEIQDAAKELGPLFYILISFGIAVIVSLATAVTILYKKNNSLHDEIRTTTRETVDILSAVSHGLQSIKENAHATKKEIIGNLILIEERIKNKIDAIRPN